MSNLYTNRPGDVSLEAAGTLLTFLIWSMVRLVGFKTVRDGTMIGEKVAGGTQNASMDEMRSGIRRLR